MNLKTLTERLARLEEKRRPPTPPVGWAIGMTDIQVDRELARRERDGLDVSEDEWAIVQWRAARDGRTHEMALAELCAAAA